LILLVTLSLVFFVVSSFAASPCLFLSHTTPTFRHYPLQRFLLPNNPHSLPLSCLSEPSLYCPHLIFPRFSFFPPKAPISVCAPGFPHSEIGLASPQTPCTFWLFLPSSTVCSCFFLEDGLSFSFEFLIFLLFQSILPETKKNKTFPPPQNSQHVIPRHMPSSV